MTEVPAAPPMESSSELEPAVEPVSAPPILITEQEVVFSTAAAVGVQPTTIPWRVRATRFIAAGSRWIFRTSTADARPKQRYYPRRYSYLEHARMARELDRL